MSKPQKDNKNPLRIPTQKSSKRKIIPISSKYRKEMIAGAIAILLALIIIILTSGGGNVGNNDTPEVNTTAKIPTKIYSAGGIYLEYPASWNVTTDEVNGNSMQIVVQDPSSTNNPNSTQLAAFTVLKVQKDPYQTLEQRKESFVQSLISSGANIAPTNTTNITINGINATETTYNGNGPKYEKIELKLVYFEQNNVIYILAFLTKGIDLQSQKPYFDVILNSFKIQ